MQDDEFDVESANVGFLMAVDIVSDAVKKSENLEQFVKNFSKVTPIRFISLMPFELP